MSLDMYPLSPANFPNNCSTKVLFFKGIAQRGLCSMGWFYGFKLHLICNEMGELLSFKEQDFR